MITSIRETMGGSYKKPSMSQLSIFIADVDKFSAGKDWLKIQRNLTDETIQNFRLGWDFYRNNIVIPEFKNRELINFAYRSLDDNVKIRYTKEKGCENWIFHESGLNEAKRLGGLLVVSNQFDCISAYQAGIQNVVSVPVGKDSIGVWMELFENIPKIYIAFENTKISKKFALEFAERVGIDKCKEVILPEDILDLNAYFKKHDKQEFKELIVNSVPYYKYKFKGIKDIIDSLRENNENVLKLNCIPYIEFEEDWLTILSGDSNTGKTSLSLNVANELILKGLPTLIMPFERGIKTVGKRFLQIHLNKTQGQLNDFSELQWLEVIPEIVNLPLFFSVPNREEIKDIVARAKRLFNIKVIIVDHLDYLVRKSTENHNVETSNTLQEFKSLAQEFNIIFIVIHHTKKPAGVGTIRKKPRMEDLKGSSSTYQDPEAVIMLSAPEPDILEVDIVKNKGKMGSRLYKFNLATGVVGKDITDGLDSSEGLSEDRVVQNNFDKF